jgi:PIN domain nuclease of toxin-antitoxin system
MTVLLDMHAFIWWDENPQNLGPKARAACQDSANEIVLSVASIWDSVKTDAWKAISAQTAS